MEKGYTRMVEPPSHRSHIMRMLAVISGSVIGKTKHYLGMPPRLTGGIDTRQELSPALFLVIEEKPDGIFLYRYGIGGVFAGDTWHKSIDDAKHQVISLGYLSLLDLRSGDGSHNPSFSTTMFGPSFRILF